GGGGGGGEGGGGCVRDRRASLKARRIARDGHVPVHVGRTDGPAFGGDAALVEDRPDLEASILEAYRRKYWILIPLWMGRYIKNGLRARTSVLVRIVPRESGAPRAGGV